MTNPISELYNPYDFANPVSDSTLFAGRSTEINEIKYYLTHAKRAPRPINLALIGPRASGKTSLLNMTQNDANSLGFVTARIDLDESDADSQLAFFYKVFNALLFASCRQGAFGGLTGKTYDTYMDMVASGEIPADKTFSPFLFPMQYARAIKANRLDNPLLDDNFKADLGTLSAEIARPALLLFDECDVLLKNSPILQKLRNVFMNTPGFMLVFAGTPNLFPILDEVFSPIIRQFKKIPVEEFKKSKETEHCITRPLEKLGVPHSNLIETETLNEIHELSGGKPYEIQLICHVLFRRIQDAKAIRMSLNLSVLEEVRNELEKSQSLQGRPLLERVRALSKQNLRALRILCSCNGRATLDQLWCIERVFSPKTSWTHATLTASLEHLQVSEILSCPEGIIAFNGDDFDKLYVKYFSEEQHVPVRISDLSLQTLWFQRQLMYLQSTDSSVRLRPLPIADDTPGVIERVCCDLADPNAVEDVFADGPPAARSLYLPMVENAGSTTMRLLCVRVMFPWLKMTWFFGEFENSDSVPAAATALEDAAKRAAEVGGQVLTEILTLPVAPLDLLRAKTVRSANANFRRQMAFEHYTAAIDEYLEDKRKTKAVLFAQLAAAYDQPHRPVASNNLGYILLAAGDVAAATPLFDRAIEEAAKGEAVTGPLSRYNRAICSLIAGDDVLAKRLLDDAFAMTATLSGSDRALACLFIPVITEGQPVLEEIADPDLVDAIDKARQVLEAHPGALWPAPRLPA